jgi:hypothetical protein
MQEIPRRQRRQESLEAAERPTALQEIAFEKHGAGKLVKERGGNLLAQLGHGVVLIARPVRIHRFCERAANADHRRWKGLLLSGRHLDIVVVVILMHSPGITVVAQQLPERRQELRLRIVHHEDREAPHRQFGERKIAEHLSRIAGIEFIGVKETRQQLHAFHHGHVDAFNLVAAEGKLHGKRQQLDGHPRPIVDGQRGVELRTVAGLNRDGDITGLVAVGFVMESQDLGLVVPDIRETAIGVAGREVRPVQPTPVAEAHHPRPEDIAGRDLLVGGFVIEVEDAPVGLAESDVVIVIVEKPNAIGLVFGKPHTQRRRSLRPDQHQPPRQRFGYLQPHPSLPRFRARTRVNEIPSAPYLPRDRPGFMDGRAAKQLILGTECG